MEIAVQLDGNKTITVASHPSGTPFYLNIPGDRAADNTFTFNATNVSEGNTVTIDGKVYTFKGSVGTADGNVHIGTASTNTRDNLHDAINLLAGEGVDYGIDTTLHPTVFATKGTSLQMFVAAKVKGSRGNSIVVAETSNGAWVGGTLIDGSDGTDAGTNNFTVTLPTDPQEGTVYEFNTQKNGIAKVSGITYFTNWKINSPIANGFVVRKGSRILLTSPTDNKSFVDESLVIGFSGTTRDSERRYKRAENIKLTFFNGKWYGNLTEGSSILGIGDI